MYKVIIKAIIVRKLLFVLISLIMIGAISSADDDSVPVLLPDPPAVATEMRLADVIAQRDITQTSFNTVNRTRGMHLGGVHVHKYWSGALNGSLAVYVYDSGNSRLLAFLNPDWTSPTERPDMVFGQNGGYQTGACNGDNNTITVPPTADSLCLNRGAHAISQEEEPRFSAMDTDSNGNLFVVDQYNNRLLMFLDPFGTDANEGDTTADRVYGQADFTSKICNRGAGIPTFPSSKTTAGTLCLTNTQPASIDPMFATGLDIDVWGNLWVTDIINNRVLRYPFEAATGFPRLTADIVLGQPNFTSTVNHHGSCVSQPDGVGFCQLFYLQVNDVTGEIFIIHNQDTPRISVYAPNTTLQNPTSYSYARKFGQGTLVFPGFLHFLDSGRIMVSDNTASWERGFRLFTTTGTLIRTMTPSNVIGTTPDGNVTWEDIKGKFLIVDNLLFMTEQRHHNSVMVFDVSLLDSSNQMVYLGELLGGVNRVWNNITSLGIRSPYGMAASDKHDQLFVSDRYRVLVWNMGSSPYAERGANYVVGQPNFTSNEATTTGPFVFRSPVGGIAVDEVNNKLWVARNEEIFAFNLPITANSPMPVANYIARIPNSIYMGNLPVKGQAENLVFRANSVAFNPIDQSLWIVDTHNSRVVRVRNPYASPQADLIVGQSNINGVSCNRGIFSAPSSRTLCFPGFAAFDAAGNLFIAEGVYEGRADMPGNKRIVEYDKATIDTAVATGLLSEPAANRVYGVTSFTANPAGGYSCPSNTPCNPIGISFDSKGRMAVLSDAYFNAQNKRIYIYREPLKNTGYVAFNPVQDLILPYAMGQGGMPAFANAYQGFYQDHTWNRIMVVHENREPTTPSYVQPPNNKELLADNVTLKWNGVVDPDADEITYNVYFGQDDTALDLVASGLTTLAYQPDVSSGMGYFWQIVATDGAAESKGPVRFFSTLAEPVILPNVSKSKDSATVEEGGDTDNYAIHLTAQPSSDVQIALSFSQDGQIAVDAAALTFTPDDWDVPQVVTISALDDTDLEGAHSVDILHTVTSEDLNYHDRLVEAVNVTIADDDFPTVELLTNTSFETDTKAPLNQPDGWVVTNKSEDRLKCDAATLTHDGLCAYLFQGNPGEKASLTQTVAPLSIPLTPGDILNVRLFYRTNAVTPSLKVRLLVYYSGPTPAKREAVINTIAQDYTSFALNPHTVKSSSSVTRIKLIFQNRAKTGKVYIDSVSLSATLTSGGLVSILDVSAPPQTD